MEIRTGYFVAFRGGGYGAFQTRQEATWKAIELICTDGNGFAASIYEGVALLRNKHLMDGSALNRIDIVTTRDCAVHKPSIFH